MAKRTFSVTGLVKSTNKPAKPVHTLVRAESEDEAKAEATRKFQRENPHGHVQIGNAR